MTNTPNLAADIEHLRLALHLIGDDCRSYTGSSTCLDDNTRSPYGRYLSDRWCEGCVVRAGLKGLPFPPLPVTELTRAVEAGAHAQRILDAHHNPSAVPA